MKLKCKATFLATVCLIASCGKSNKVSDSRTYSSEQVPKAPEAPSSSEPNSALAITEQNDFTIVKNDRDVQKFSGIFKKEKFIALIVDHECADCFVAPNAPISIENFDDLSRELEVGKCNVGMFVSRNALRRVDDRIQSHPNVWGIHLSPLTIAKRYGQKELKGGFQLLKIDRDGKAEPITFKKSKASLTAAVAKVCM